ncbi:MAG: hypothetical protein CMP39_03945 [Rickettsiales bacterium]|nr:hypothetical protein [Rickettsiales bacterium]|tara:strand:+ start:15196 stop:15585 length:390 start_codon:yes stop_codon:yes gene_type:complete
MTKTNEKKEISNSKLLRKALKLTIKDLKSFKEVELKRSTIIRSQDVLGNRLTEENKAKLDKYMKNNFNNNLDAKINMLSDILFRNFDIQSATLEVLKCYVDEYFDRFNLLEKNLSITLNLLDKYIQEKD